MFKYVEFTKVKNDVTTLEFRGGDEEVIVNHFDVDVVSISCADESKIDALIASQPSDIGCTVITKEEFVELVKDTAQLNRIRDRVKQDVAKKYSLADEIAMMKKDATDTKRIAYEEYVTECIAFGNSLKDEIGY